MGKSQHRRAGSRHNPAQAKLSSQLRALSQDARLFSEEHTDVSDGTRKRVIRRLLLLRETIATLGQGTYRFLYPVELSTLERMRQDALIDAQAFHLEYDQLELRTRLRRLRRLRFRLAECLEAGCRASEAIILEAGEEALQVIRKQANQDKRISGGGKRS